MGRDVELAKAIIELSGMRQRPFDETRYARDLLRHSSRLLNADAAGVILTGADGRLDTVIASSETARLLQIIQLHYDAGPSIVSYRARRQVSVADLNVEEGDSDIFRSATLSAGFPAVHAFPLLLAGEAIGSLILFRRSPGELGSDDRVVGKALASMATAYLLTERDLGKAERLGAQLENALRSRVVIEQAKGILAERHDLPMNSAFETMRSFARNSRRRLEDVARAVIENSPDIARLTQRPISSVSYPRATRRPSMTRAQACTPTPASTT